MTPYRKNGRKHRQFVKLTINGKSKEVPVMKIMQQTFLGDAPSGEVPYHKKGILTDNRVDNIGFISRQMLGHITGGRTAKTKCVFKIDRKGDVVEIYTSARKAAKANHMSYQTVLDRCHNKVKKPFELDGYTYQFEKT
jgi:hypothetical protein